MDDRDDNVPDEYLKSFNKGYTIAQTMPELAAQLAKAKGNSLELEGLKQGIQQANLDRDKQQNRDKLNKELLPEDLYDPSRDYPSWLKDDDKKSYYNIEPDKDLDKE